MTDQVYEAVSRLKAWIRDYGSDKYSIFIKDVETVFAELSRLQKEYEQVSAVNCDAIMKYVDQTGNMFSIGPCILPEGHVAHDGRPDSHTDGKNCWGGE